MQSKVAALPAGGTDLDAAAATLGISKQTARRHLRVFARTGVRRQPELVALMARLLPVGAGALPCSPKPPESPPPRSKARKDGLDAR